MGASDREEGKERNRGCCDLVVHGKQYRVRWSVRLRNVGFKSAPETGGSALVNIGFIGFAYRAESVVASAGGSALGEIYLIGFVYQAVCG